MQAYPQDYTKEFFSVKDQPVMFVVRGTAVLQAWVPDKDSGSVRRRDELVADRSFHPKKYTRVITEVDFLEYCRENRIDPAISEKSLHLSFFLADTGPTPRTTTQPTPKRGKVFNFPSLVTT